MPALPRFWNRLSIAQIVVIGFVAAVGILGVSLYAVSSSLIRTVVVDQAAREARIASEGVFQGLYGSMRAGWPEAEIATLIERASNQLPGARVQLVRGAPVEALFGKTSRMDDQTRMAAEIAEVLSSGHEIVRNDGKMIDFIYPFVAKQECLHCHTNGKVGDVNGVAHITIPLGTLSRPLRAALGMLIQMLLVVTALMLVAQFLIMRRVLVRPITQLTDHIMEMQRTQELTRRSLAEDTPEVFLELHLLAESFDNLMEDVSRTQEQLREQSERDELTGLMNRRSFNRLLKHELARAKRYAHPLALFLIDLDGFKEVNDNYGHILGDALLRRCATRLTQNVRQNDIVARLGGDELVVAAPETDHDAALLFKDKLRQLLEQTETVNDGNHFRIGASVGVAIYPVDGDDPAHLLMHADSSMYREKREKKERHPG